MATAQRDLVTPAQRSFTRTSRWQKVIGLAGLGVVLWVGNDLFDIVTSGGIRPGGDPGRPAPPAETPITPPIDGEAPDPGDGGHDPSQFDHP